MMAHCSTATQWHNPPEALETCQPQSRTQPMEAQIQPKTAQTMMRLLCSKARGFLVAHRS